MNYCTACGSQLLLSAAYCTACGTAINVRPAGVSAVPSGPMQQVAPAPNPEPSHDEEGWQKSPVPLSSPQTSGLRLALSIIGLIGFGLMLLTVTIAWIF